MSPNWDLLELAMEWTGYVAAWIGLVALVLIGLCVGLMMLGELLPRGGSVHVAPPRPPRERRSAGTQTQIPMPRQDKGGARK